MKSYYLDNAATTKMFEDVFKQASVFLCENYYNPSAVYSCSVKVKRVIEDDRKFMLSILKGNGDLFFTGSATESNNTIILTQKILSGKRYLFGSGEHPSVIECAKELEKKGAKVEFIPLNNFGEIDIEKYKSMLDENVEFISIQHVSNETGAINNIKELVKIARSYNKNVKFHSDGVQAFMKFDYSLLDLDVDYYTISAHKIGGPKGTGAFYVKKGTRINPYIFGGGQEFGERSGTENVFGIHAFRLATEKMVADRDNNYNIIKQRRNDLLSELNNLGVDYEIHGRGVPHTMNIKLSSKVRGETLVHSLEARNIYISTGSACSATKHYNRTLEAMGVSNDDILKSVRISFSAYEDFDAKEIAKIIVEEINKF